MARAARNLPAPTTEGEIGEFTREFLFSIILSGSDGPEVKTALKLIETQFLSAMTYSELIHLLKTFAAEESVDTALMSSFINLVASMAPEIASKMILQYWLESNVLESILVSTQAIFPHFLETVDTVHE